MGRMFLLFHMEWVMTREEYVPNKRIVDHANTGGVWTFTFEPDDTGTTLTGSFGWSSKVPFVGEHKGDSRSCGRSALCRRPGVRRGNHPMDGLKATELRMSASLKVREHAASRVG